MKLNRQRKFIVASILILITLVMLELLPSLYLSANTTGLSEINQLRTELDLPVVTVDLLPQYSPVLIVSRYQQLSEFHFALSQKSEYQRQKQAIISNFDTQLDQFVLGVSDYSQIDLSFLPTSKQDIPFSTKKNSDEFIAGLKQQFRNNVIKYNETAEKPVRWEIDIEKEITQMSTDEKIGLLFGFPVVGNTLTTADKEFIQKNHIGSVPLFGPNVASPEQLATLTNSLQKLSTKYSLLITTDQEGPPVQRLYWDNNGSTQQIGALSESDQCARWTSRANILSLSGVNWNLGTVADVSQDTSSFIYSRTFSQDYSKAAANVKIASECSPQVLSTLKHWPGHGSTTVDTHKQLGKLSVQTEAEWKQKDFLPFAAGIEARADAVMIGHLLTPWMDANTPASLSKQHIEYLRNTIGFKGMIVTDDLFMLVASGISLEQSTRQALLAGNDLLFVVIKDNNQKQKLVDIAKELVAEGEITESDLNARVGRILVKINKTQVAPISSELLY